MSKSAAPLLVLILAVSSIVAFLPVKGEYRTIVVPDDYASIQEALDNANDGDTIFVKKGVYVENPEIFKAITLIGEDRDGTVIDVTEGLKVERDNVTVAGFTIYDGWRGISLAASCCNVSGNRITNSTNGIVLFGHENYITGNIFESIGLSSAIQLNFANRNYVKNNYVDSCVEGIQIWQNSNNNTIRENTIINCQDTAINFQYSNDNVIVGNNISCSGLGTSIYGSNNNSITNNNYFDNFIQFSANEYYYLTFGHNRSVNTINENYWSDYIGSDSNNDGKGDTPYVIDEYNKDNYPLMVPYQISPSPELTPTPSQSPEPKPQQEPFPATLFITASAASVTVVGVGLLVYFKKRKR